MSKTGRIIGKVLKYTAIGLVGLIVALLVAVYLPPVQDLVVGQVVKSVNAKGDMHIDVKRVRLGFPLRLQVDSLELSTAGMHVGTAALSADMAVLPLLRGEILGRRLCASGAVVDIGTPDSAMYMTTRLKMAEIDDASVRLSSQQIEVGCLRGAGARVRMLMRPDTVAPEVKTDTVPVRWHIALGQADLSDVDFGMQMQPLIDTLACVVPRASVRGAMVDMSTNRIAVDDIAIDSVDARYIYFPAEYAASYPLKAAEPADTAASQPWTVTARSLSLTNSRALYALKGYSPPTAAFDPQYIAASEIDIAVDSFRNRGQEITVPIRRISARERCGVPLSLTGWFGMDSTAMTARNILLSTPTSAVKLDGSMGIAPAGSTLTLMQLPVELRLNARISNDDMRRLVPYPSTAIVRQLPPSSPLEADVDLAGVASQRVELRRCLVRIPGYVEVTAQGCVDNMLGGLDRMTADISLTGRMRNGNFLKPMFLDAKTGKEINLPPLSVSGNVTARNGVVSGDVQARTAGGALALDASWNNRSQGYDLTLDASSFPLQSIMPGLEMSDIDADVTAVGRGLDPFSPETDMKARIGLRHMVYKGQSLDNIVADATLAGGVADLKVTSANKAVDLTVAATGNLAGSELVWNFDGDIRNLDLKALGMSPTVSEGSVKLTGDARLDFARPPFAPAKGDGQADVLALLRGVQASVDVSSLYWRMPDMTVNGNDVMLRLDADTAVTMARLDNHDLSASFTAYDSPAGLLPRLSQTAAVVEQQIKARGIKADTLHTTLPRFNLDFKAGRDNILANYLLDLDMKFDSVSFMAANDSIITARGNVVSLQVGKTTIDSVALTMHQRHDYLVYDITVDNKPGTMDQFAWINGRGYLGPENFALAVKQKNIGGDTGFSFGTLINMPDSSTVLLRFVPYHPVIGYKDWQINRDNFIKYNMASRHLDANIDLRNDVSTLQILTEHHQGDSAQEDLVVRLKDIELADWATLTPFAPPVKGNLSADVRLGIQGADINGRGTLGLTGLTYAGQPVGDFDMGLDVTTNTSGVIKATTSLKVNGQEAITASGVLNDSTASNPFMLDCRVIRFPLSVANAFLPQGTARMAGVLNGEMEVTGQMSSPRFNGWLAFDSASVTPAMLGTALAFPSDRIPVDDNVVRFNNFAIKAVNDNPLRINGWVNMQDMSVMKLDLDIKANNMQLVGGKRQRGADVYGKAFVDVDARVKGSTRFMSVDASLALLAGSNVTYVIPTLTQTLSQHSMGEMVKFVNFNDTTAVAEADSLRSDAMMMNVDARVTVQPGTTVGVDLSTDGKNRVQVQSAGSMTYSLDYMGDQRFSGRLNINDGFVRYSMPPILSEKNFKFEEGSYVAFNGDMLNPILNIKAYDQLRANVTQQGADSRLVNFDVGLTVTGTLENMDVAFDLSTNDDLTVENELKSMSPEQRANQAMNMLLYNVYTGPGTKGAVGGNPLFSLLESQLNNLAASAIKGVDVSFGINQYDKTVNGSTSSTMNYSYRVSKSLFDDRFKIVVGGNYATDADADENFAQNLIADISFEYLLNRQGTMYVRLFRHTGYESILEGEVIQTGVGFVYKKRISRLGDIFRFLRRKRRAAPQAVALPQLAPGSQDLPAAPPAPGPETPIETIAPTADNKTQQIEK